MRDRTAIRTRHSQRKIVTARVLAASACLMLVASAHIALAQRDAQSGNARGVVRTDTVWSQSLGIRKAVRVYLPPSYAVATTKRYPVL
ncbi:MAG: hypothetical protein ABI777_02960, partial [Betaproteobacteria bacterium]